MKSKLFSSLALVLSIFSMQLNAQLKESREKAIAAQLKNPTWTFRAIVDTAQLTFFNVEDSILTEEELEGESEGIKDKFCVF